MAKDERLKTFQRLIVLQTDFGLIDITHDKHILKNLDYSNPKIRVDFVEVKNG